jgi:hypothetical protein
MFAVCPLFAAIATVVLAVEVEVTEKTAYGDDEPIAVRPSFVMAKNDEEADWVFVKIPKA